MGNTNTKLEQQNINTTIETSNETEIHEQLQQNKSKDPKKAEVIPAYEQLKRQNSLLSKIIPQESQNTSGQSYKPKKFDKEKFKIANQPYFLY